MCHLSASSMRSCPCAAATSAKPSIGRRVFSNSKPTTMPARPDKRSDPNVWPQSSSRLSNSTEASRSSSDLRFRALCRGGNAHAAGERGARQCMSRRYCGTRGGRGTSAKLLVVRQRIEFGEEPRDAAVPVIKTRAYTAEPASLARSRPRKASHDIQPRYKLLRRRIRRSPRAPARPIPLLPEVRSAPRWKHQRRGKPSSSA